MDNHRVSMRYTKHTKTEGMSFSIRLISSLMSLKTWSIKCSNTIFLTGQRCKRSKIIHGFKDRRRVSMRWSKQWQVWRASSSKRRLNGKTRTWEPRTRRSVIDLFLRI